MSKINFLPPWVETNLQPAFYDLESGTVLQQTARMYAKVNQLIRTLNEFGIRIDNIEEYVYNLDIQEEVNKKLDEMSEDGTLQDIILNYVNVTKVYDTFTELLADSSNLSDGMLVQCLGYAVLNDGFGGFYRITDSTTNISLGNGLYAIALNNNEDNYTDNITITESRYYDTTCYITTIPLNDSVGRQINPTINERSYSNQTPIKYAQDNDTTLTINGALSIMTTGGTYEYPYIIGDGQVLSNNDLTGDSLTYSCYQYLCFDNERNITSLPVKTTTLAYLQNAGFTQVTTAYYQIVENSQAVDLSSLPSPVDGVATTLRARQVLGVKNDKTIVILTSNGGTGNDLGLTSAQTATIMLGLGCTNAWNLDGGGSTNLTYKGSKVNNSLDDNLTTDRYIRFTFNVKNPINNKNIADCNSKSGNDKYELIKYLMPLIPFVKSDNTADADDVIANTTAIYGNQLVNTPATHGHLINLPNTWTQENRKLYNKQLFFPYDKRCIYTRQMSNGSWSGWSKLQNLFASVPASNLTLTADDTYENITISGSVSYYAGDYDIKINDDNTFSFNNNDGNALQVIVQGRVKGSSNGQKYIKVTKNGSDVYYIICRCSSTSDFHGFSFSAPLIVTNSSDKFSVQCYGKTGDAFSNMRILVKS